MIFFLYFSLLLSFVFLCFSPLLFSISLFPPPSVLSLYSSSFFFLFSVCFLFLLLFSSSSLFFCLFSSSSSFLFFCLFSSSSSGCFPPHYSSRCFPSPLFFCLFSSSSSFLFFCLFFSSFSSLFFCLFSSSECFLFLTILPGVFLLLIFLPGVFLHLFLLLISSSSASCRCFTLSFALLFHLLYFFNLSLLVHFLLCPSVFLSFFLSFCFLFLSTQNVITNRMLSSH